MTDFRDNIGTRDKKKQFNQFVGIVAVFEKNNVNSARNNNGPDDNIGQEHTLNCKR